MAVQVVETYLCSSASCSMSPIFCASCWRVFLKLVYWSCSSIVAELGQASCSLIETLVGVCLTLLFLCVYLLLAGHCDGCAGMEQRDTGGSSKVEIKARGARWWTVGLVAAIEYLHLAMLLYTDNSFK